MIVQVINLLILCSIACQIVVARPKVVTTPSPVDALAQVVNNIVNFDHDRNPDKVNC